MFVQIMKQMWPYIGEYIEGLMRTSIQQSIRGSLPSKFQNFSFETIDLGDVVRCTCARNILYMFEKQSCTYWYGMLPVDLGMSG